VDEIDTTKRVLHDRDASRLYESLRDADTLVLGAELSHQADLDVALDMLGRDVN
jgi:hypothetical protein